ncbi:MAG: DUF4280 domain-containing protein [Cyanobacteria bacterium]|nr:DUF4280 domain-containing protein [Cyanobacteriota bacterium]MDA0865413.1 DUF4280 domain-containing protein [Cyanobacteriota bacterium]
MAKLVCQGALLQCSFGVAPSSLMVIPKGPPVTTSYMNAATIMDFVPMANIMPFGMCSAPTNPAVIATTAAALGVFTPAPCIPATVAPWVPGAATPPVLINNLVALNNSSKCMCMWAGVISVQMPGQFTVDVP